MTFKKLNIPVLISIILACTAGCLVFVLLKSSIPSVPVVTAKQNLSIGAEITESDLQVKQYPSIAVPKSSFRSKEQVIGQTVVAGPIIVDDVVRAEHLSGQGALLATLNTLAPKGWVAVELPETAGQGLKGVRRGNAVDIYAEGTGEQGVAVYAIVKGAKVIGIPSSGDDKSKNYIVAVPEKYASIVAELTVRNKPVTLVLPSAGN